MSELVRIEPQSNVEAYRASTEAAAICKEIVVATSMEIQRRRYVSVEGWQAVAVAHGCAAGARDVERVDGGIRAVGEVRRMSDGQLIAVAEGFVGEDEPVWFGGTATDKWGKTKTHQKRPDYAIRAMAQTRAISRACRSAFAHVVVMMNAGLATTPAEEVPYDGFDNHDHVTGEVREPVKEPAAREKLDGPHDCKTKLRKAVIDIITAVRKVETIDELEALKKEHKRTINQALRDWPSLIDGDPNIPEDLGLKGEIEKRRSALDTSLGFQFLASCVRESKTADDLASLMEAHEGAISELDGEESRRFEELFNEREEALKNPTPLTAGAYGA